MPPSQPVRRQRVTYEGRSKTPMAPACTNGPTRSADETKRRISWHFERDPIPYALETDLPVGAAGLETLHQESCAIAPAVIVHRK